ncbi:MAG TPA: hypothetical protein VF848_00040 [Steroidobacteraceae bacterium]
MNTKHFSAPSRYGLAVLSVLVLLLVAYNFIGEWWFWEHRMSAAGYFVGTRAHWLGRLNLLWAGAVLCAALAAFEFLRTVPKLTRLAGAAGIAALVLGVMPWVLRYLIQN